MGNKEHQIQNKVVE